MTDGSKALVGSVLAIAAFFVFVQTAVLPPEGFWTGDQGAKYLQSVAFAEHPFNPSVDVRSRDIDPEYRYQILFNRDGKLVATFSWLMPILTAPFLKLLGMRGLYVIPALSAIAIFLLAVALGRRLGLGTGLWTGWGVVLTAPVLIYGAENWEHAPAAACVMGAALLFAPDREGRWRFAGGGALLAVGALFREEAIVALPAFLAARAVARGGVRAWADTASAGLPAGLGAAAVFAATIPGNLFVYGSVLPLHLTSEVAKTGAYLDMRFMVLHDLLLPTTHPKALTIAVIALAASAAARAWSRRDPSGPPWADDVLLAVAVASTAVVLAVGALSPLWRTMMKGVVAPELYRVGSVAHSWLFCVPIAFIPWLGKGSARPSLDRFLGVGAVLTVLWTLAIVPSSGGGWGPRYLFTIAPILAVLAARAGSTPPGPWSTRGAVVTWSARAALLSACAMQMHGLAYVADAKARNARITERLSVFMSPDEVVISNVPWFPQVVATLMPTRRILLARAPDEIEQIAELAATKGFAALAFVGCEPETGYTAKTDIMAAQSRCRYERHVRFAFSERVLTFDRYICKWP
jgi:hypothetical protein